MRGVLCAVALIVFASACSDSGGTAKADPPDATVAPPADRDDPRLMKVLDGVVGDPTTEPGCAVAVSRRGEVEASATVGMADLEHQVPITVDTVFDIGSVSKQFTAAAVLLLADDGALSVSDDMHDTIPDLPDYGGPVTLDLAMHHTSGIPDYVDTLAIEFKNADVTTADDAYLLLLALTTPDFEPGTNWSYSNSNYFLLGLVVEEVTGKELEDVLEERIFGPLGMDATSLRDHFDEVVDGVAMAYRSTAGEEDAAPDGPWAVDMTNWEQVGDGAVQSSVQDLLTWQAALDSGGAAPFDLYGSLQFDPADMGDGKTGYARGVIRSEHDGFTTVGHSGTSAGYRSALEAIPDEGLAVAVLCNRPDADAEEIALDSLEAMRD